MVSSTLNFQVQHQVANEIKVIYSRSNSNREIYLRYPTCTQRPRRVPVQLLESCLVLEKVE